MKQQNGVRVNSGVIGCITAYFTWRKSCFTLLLRMSMYDEWKGEQESEECPNMN